MGEKNNNGEDLGLLQLIDYSGVKKKDLSLLEEP